MSGDLPSSRVRNHRGLEALGLAGDRVDIQVELGVLHLRGTMSGALAVPPEAVERLRLFREPRRLRSRGYDQVEIWRDRNEKPLSIDTVGSDAEALRRVVAAFAAAVASRRGASPLQVGAVGLVAAQQRARLIIGALVWLAIFGAAIWVLTGVARAIILGGLLAIAWQEVRRLRARWRAGSLWRRDARDLADFLAVAGRG